MGKMENWKVSRTPYLWRLVMRSVLAINCSNNNNSNKSKKKNQIQFTTTRPHTNTHNLKRTETNCFALKKLMMNSKDKCTNALFVLLALTKKKERENDPQEKKVCAPSAVLAPESTFSLRSFEPNKKRTTKQDSVCEAYRVSTRAPQQRYCPFPLASAGYRCAMIEGIISLSRTSTTSRQRHEKKALACSALAAPITAMWAGLGQRSSRLGRCRSERCGERGRWTASISRDTTKASRN